MAAAAIKLGAEGKRAPELQKGVDRILGRRKFDWRKVEIDGVAGLETFRAAHFALWLIGASEDQLRRVRREHRITDHAFKLLTGEIERSVAMKRRDEQRRPEVRRLRAEHKKRGTLAGVQIRSTAPGETHWGGSRDVMEQFVEPFMLHRGLPLGSHKRTPAYNAAIGGSPVSDHLTTHTTTDARDFPTFSGEDDARALAAAIGWKSWSPNSYATFEFTVDGHRFRIQILWGSGIGHGDHVHVGISILS
jgi:hypothetical protein